MTIPSRSVNTTTALLFDDVSDKNGRIESFSSFGESVASVLVSLLFMFDELMIDVVGSSNYNFTQKKNHKQIQSTGNNWNAMRYVS